MLGFMWILVITVIFVFGLSWALNDDNKDVVAWREGNKWKAVGYFFLTLLKSFLFFFFVPFLFIMFILKD